MRLFSFGSAFLLFVGAALAAPGDLEDTYQKLQDAQTKNDPALVKKLAAETCALARKAIASPAPESESEKEAWNATVENARRMELYTEYALYATAVQGKPATTVDLLSALEEQNPNSKYLDAAYAQYFLALNQTGAAAKIVPVAQKAVEHHPDNEDVLLVLADSALNASQSDRAVGYASRLVDVLNKHGKPEGLSAADWERKRTAALGRAHWICGVVYSSQNKYTPADRELRAALPLIQGNEAMLSTALFNLGVVNYQIGRLTNNKALVLEAAKFSDKAASMKGPYAEQAWKNAHIMRTEAVKMH